MPIDLMLGLLLGSTAIGLLLLFDLVVGRAARDGVILRLRGQIAGPGERGSVVHRRAGATPFLVRSRHGTLRVLPRDAVVCAPWPLSQRALRVGDGVVVDGLLGQERVAESLYRDAGSREAIDAVRLTPRRWVLIRGVALVLSAATLLGGVLLWRRPLHARLAWGLACPPGSSPAYREEQLPRGRAPVELSELGALRGQLAACTVDGRPHGPAVERWTGEQGEGVWRRSGSYRDALQHGHWVTWSPEGKVVSEGELLAGKRNGVFRTWYANGRLRTKEDYLEGKRHGPFASWDPHGAPEDQGLYLEGKRVGAWTLRSPEARCPLPFPRWLRIESVELGYHEGELEGPASCTPTRMRAPLLGELRANGRATRLFTSDPSGSRAERARLPWRAAIAPERIGCRLCAAHAARGWPELGLDEVVFDVPDPMRERERALSELVWRNAEDLLRCLHRAADAHEPVVEERVLALRVNPDGRLTPVADEVVHRTSPSDQAGAVVRRTAQGGQARGAGPAPVLACLRDALARWPADDGMTLRGREVAAELRLRISLHRDRAPE